MPTQHKQRNWMKRYKYFSSAVVAVLAATLAFLLNFGVSKYGIPGNMHASGGYLDMIGHDWYNAQPVRLNGEWEVYTGTIVDPNDVDSTAARPGLVNLPLSSMESEADNISYRLRLAIDSDIEDIAIFYPFASYETKLYFDGVLINYHPLHGTQRVSKINKHLFNIGINPGMQHEIVITSENNGANLPLFNVVPIIGGVSAMGNYTVCMWGMEFFLMGMLMYIVLNGLLFMVLRPEHTMITRQTVFDTLIGVRMIFGSALYHVLMDAILRVNMHSDILIRLQLIFMLLSSYAGNKLICGLFNEDVVTPVLRHVCHTYIIEAIAVFFLPLAALDVIRYLLLLTVVMNYCLLCPIVFKGLKKNRNWYYTLQAVKTVYISIVILLDIMQIAGLLFTTFGFYVYYCTFFLVHLFIKLVDNNASYKANEQLANTLEDQVQERTAQLLAVNKQLEELSTKDALTDAYNRLHFERFMEQAINDYKKQEYDFHMCIMDVDFFKTIIDKYGHDIGDEILKQIVRLVKISMPVEMELFRIGGEEFVIAIRHMAWDDALAVIEAIRSAIGRHSFVNGIRLTASFGVASYSSQITYKKLFRLVDQCLYEAKHNGRNRIVTPSGLPADVCNLPY